jgi:hypothetical protein
MQSEYFVLNRAASPKRRRGLALAGALALVGTVSAFLLLNSYTSQDPLATVLYGDEG